MNLEISDRGDTKIVSVQETRIDSMVAIQFKEAVRSAKDEHTKRLLLDMSLVEFLDSSGLGATVAAMKLLAPDCLLELSALQPNVERVFRLTKMDTIFTIHAKAEDAFTNGHVKHAI